jgi:hypothetical protein
VRPLIRDNLQLHHISQRDMRISSLRKMSLTTIVMVLIVVAMTMSTRTLFSTAVPVAFGERIALDSEQTVTVTTNDIDQNNATDRQVSSLRITQSPEKGLEVECGGDLKCEILDNNTVVATGQNTTMITSALNALNQTLTQSLNQSSILLPFGNNEFDMLDEKDLDSRIDELIDRILNETLGDLRTPLQTPPGLLSVSI